MSYKRYQWLMRNLLFHPAAPRIPAALCQEFLNDQFACMRWLVTTFENNVHKHYRHTEFVCIDETLHNYYNTYDFKVYMPDKPGKYGLLFRCMNDAIDRYVSQVIPPPAEKKQKQSESTHSRFGYGDVH